MVVLVIYGVLGMKQMQGDRPAGLPSGQWFGSVACISHVICQTMHDHFPQGFEEWYPGKWTTLVPQQGLTTLGPFYEICSDGHEKLGKQVLQMENVGISIYAWKDKWSGCLLKFVVTPDCCSAGAVGHLFLDLLEQLGSMSFSQTMHTETDRCFVRDITELSL